jgi:uncharacterized iron-regulated membrane protein
MRILRKIIFWSHLVAGVTAGLVILVMSVTGALLAFQPQIVRFAERNVRVVQLPSADVKPLGMDDLLKRVLEARPDLKPSGITVQSSPTSAVIFNLGREDVLYIDPYTGAILGEGSKSVRQFFHEVTDWHRWLGMHGETRYIGKGITGISNAIFLILTLTGIYLWWPKKWSRQYLSNVTIFNFKLSGRARNFNWHNVAGIWSAPILILLTFTGLVISYQWAGNLLYTLTGSEPPAASNQRQNQGAGQTGSGNGRGAEANPNRGEGRRPEAVPINSLQNLDQLWTRTLQHTTEWESISLRLQPNGAASFTIIESNSWNPLARSQLVLDSATAEVISWEPYSGFNAGRRLRSWIRPAHTGEAGGLIGQILAFLASLGGGLLVWTGLALAWRRFRKRKITQFD